MERLGTALKDRFQLEVPRSDTDHQGLVAAGEVGWAVEQSALFGEDFSVDDLLDFGEIMELEKKEAEEEEEEEQVERAEAEPFQISNSTSGVSCDLLAPAEIEFPVSTHSKTGSAFFLILSNFRFITGCFFSWFRMMMWKSWNGCLISSMIRSWRCRRAPR